MISKIEWISIIGFGINTLVSFGLWLLDALYREDHVQLVHAPRLVELKSDGGSAVSLVQLIRQMPSLSGPDALYHQPWWHLGGLSQTVYCAVENMLRIDTIQYQRRLLHIPEDGGTLALDFAPQSENELVPETPIVVLLPGLTGGSHEKYVQDTVSELTRSFQSGGLGARAVVVNHRGCSGSPVTSPKLYHGGTTDDLRSAILYIVNRFPRAPLFAIGFSVGANQLVKYLGENGSNTPIKAAVSVANVFDFYQGIKQMERGNLVSQVLNRVLGNAQRDLLRIHSSEFPLGHQIKWNFEEIFCAPWWKVTMRWYDDRISSKAAGCIDGLEYYAVHSSYRFLSSIKTPLLALNALDDPIAFKENLPWQEIVESEYAVLATTRRGGHLGWFNALNSRGPAKRWFCKPINEFFEAILGVDPLPRVHDLYVP